MTNQMGFTASLQWFLTENAPNIALAGFVLAIIGIAVCAVVNAGARPSKRDRRNGLLAFWVIVFGFVLIIVSCFGLGNPVASG